MKANRDSELLLMITEHCQRIEDACNRFGNSLDAFESDADYQDVINMNIFQIGELANQVSDETKVKYNEIPWHQLYGIRNIMAHAYIKVDTKIVWDTVQKDIPRLKKVLLEDR